MILLDTPVLLWLWIRPDRLSAPAAAAIEGARAEGGLAIAAISLVEVADLVAAGRVRVTGTTEGWLARCLAESGMGVRPLTPVVAAIAAELDGELRGDPYDRLIAATARADGLDLVTADERLRASPRLRTIW